MPQRPDVLCAGGCGKLLWRGRGSRPPGEATCRACRKVKSVPYQHQPDWVPKRQGLRKICSVCGTSFRTKTGRRTCSEQCLADGLCGLCVDCGTPTQRHPARGQRLCVACRDARRRARWRRKNAVRRGSEPVGRRLSIEELGERDGWRCHLCRKRVNPRWRAPDPRSATFDHLIPVSDGGNDSPENLRLAHWHCNSSRGAGGVVQLLLVG